MKEHVANVSNTESGPKNRDITLHLSQKDLELKYIDSLAPL